MPTVIETLTRGLEHQRAGRLPEAESFYRTVLSADPANADALHLLGVIACQAGRFDAGVSLVQQAIRRRPAIAPFHNTLGNALRSLGRFADALFAFEWALRLDAGFVEAHVNLGNVLQDLGRSAEAVPHYRQALMQRRDSPEIYNNLSNALRNEGQLDEAVAALRQAIALNPEYLEAYVNLSAALLAQGDAMQAEACCRQALRLNPEFPPAHSNLAAVFLAQSRFQEAEAAAREALRLQPDYAEAHHNLGCALEKQDLTEAIAHYREALRLKPDLVEASLSLGTALERSGQIQEALPVCQELARRKPDHPAAHANLAKVLFRLERLEEAEACCRAACRVRRNTEHLRNLAAVLARQGRFREAESCCHEALQLDREDVEVHRTLGNIYWAQRRLEEAAASYGAALEIRPEDAGTRWNRAMLFLLRGEFTEGWREYEWRWRRPDAVTRNLLQPLWDGTSLVGRRILVYGEQGLGDTLQFVRYLPLVERAGGRVIFECQAGLLRLLANVPGAHRVIGYGDALPDFDVQAPLMSLPGIFGTTVETIPAQAPYLPVDAARVALWRDRLASPPGYRVGVAWTGNPQNSNNRERSLDPSWLAPLLRIPGVSLINLQKESGETDLPLHRLEGWDDIADTAAIVTHLDLVISVDTMLAHLAGALGRPVWTLLAFAADFRWLLDRADSPWYPTMRLYRQPGSGDWNSVMAAVARDLRNVRRG